MRTPRLTYFILFIMTMATFALGTWFYVVVEDLRVVEAYYLSVMTLTTVGYGDFTPTTDLGKIFTSLYVLVGVGIIGIFIRTVIQGAGERIAHSKLKNNHHKG